MKILPVDSKRLLKTFIDLPWRIYAHDPNWVPPLKSELARLLTPGKHPYWRNARRALFVAMRDDRPVGRIAALVDEALNRHQSENGAAWGFFECENNPETAQALFISAENWAQDQGATFIRGPLNPSTNYEIGTLVQGFQYPPTIMMTYNPQYYPEIIRLCGYRKEKDVLAYYIDRSVKLPDWAIQVSQRLSAKGEFTLRKANLKDLANEVRLLNQVYAACWGDNWGFSPSSDAEISEHAKSLKQILDPDMTFFLYHGDKPIGAGLFLPDINPFLKRLNGKLGPSALIKKYLYWKEIKGVRAIMFGVTKEYHQMGLPFLVFDYVMRTKEQKPQYKFIEMGWTLEDNRAINQFMEDFGGKCYKRYRIYRKNFKAQSIIRPEPIANVEKNRSTFAKSESKQDHHGKMVDKILKFLQS